MKNNFITKIIGATLAFAMMIGGAVGINAAKEAREVNAAESTTTYTFSTKSWDASPANWTSGKDGAGFSNGGIQVTTAVSGANGTSPKSFTNVSKIVLTYNTNKSAGAGTAKVKIGSNPETSQSWSYSSGDGRTANYKLTYNYATVQTGNIKVTLNTTTNSIYLVSCEITEQGGEEQPISKVRSVTINDAPDSTITDVTVGTAGPVLTATATMREGDDAPSFTWASDNENAVKIGSTTGAIQYVGNGTAHITATANLPAGDQQGDTNVGTVTIETSNLKGASANNPLNVTEALALAEATGTTATTYDCYTAGIISRVGSEAFNSQYGNKTFWISANGSNNNELEAFHCLYLNGQKMNESQFNSVEAGDTVTIAGKLVNYNSNTKEYAQGCYLVAHTKPALPRVSIQESSQSINGGSTLTLHAVVENPVENYSLVWESGDTDILTVASSGELTATVTAGNNAGSTTVLVKMLDSNSSVAATSASITITVTVPLLTNGDTIVFYYDGHYLTDINESKYGNKVDSKEDAFIYTVANGSVEDSYAFGYNGSYLCWNNNNTLEYTDSIASKSSWRVTGLSLTNCVISNVADSSRKLEYNTGSPRFACYTGTQQAVSIEKVTAPEVDTVSATLEDKTYYEGNKLLASDFTVTVTWTEGKSDTHPQDGFTWTVNGVEDGDLTSGANTIVVTYEGNQSEPFQVTALARTPEMYLGNSESFMSLSGNESSPARTIVFSELGLENGALCADPFDIGEIATITFSEGSNPAKYYDGGTGVRVYGGGKIEIESKSDEKINKITLTWDGSYAPTSNSVVDTGSFNYTTSIWTGDAKKVTFTRPTGSGQWRLQSVRVVRGEDTLAVSNIALRFGASIPVDDWAAINENENWEITDYGVMLYKTKAQYAESAPTVQARYAANHSYVAVFNKGSGVAPTAEDGKYTFTARIDYTDETEYSKYIIAQAFIVVNGTDYYFLGEEMRESVRSLAGKANVETNLSSDALTYLTTAGN